MILTPWPEYRDIRPEDVARALAILAGRIVIDPYSILEQKGAERSELIHYTLGRPGRTTTSEQITCCSIKIPFRSARHALSLWGQPALWEPS